MLKKKKKKRSNERFCHHRDFPESNSPIIVLKLTVLSLSRNLGPALGMQRGIMVRQLYLWLYFLTKLIFFNKLNVLSSLKTLFYLSDLVNRRILQAILTCIDQ